MEITPFTVYLISRLTPLYEFITALTIASVVAMVVGAIMFVVVTVDHDWDDDVMRTIRRYFRWLIITFLVFGSLTVVVPSTKDAAAMIVLPRIANSQSVQELGDTVVELAKAWCEELKPKKAEDKK